MYIQPMIDQVDRIEQAVYKMVQYGIRREDLVIKTGKQPDPALTSIMGIPVVVDPYIEPGRWYVVPQEKIRPDVSMKPYTWNLDQSLEEQKEGAYWERNMLALLLAKTMNESNYNKSGWYAHQGEGFDGWSRVISIDGGKITFHVPDDFDLGALPEIKPNWNGHTTEEKWNQVMQVCGCILRL